MDYFEDRKAEKGTAQVDPRHAVKARPSQSEAMEPGVETTLPERGDEVQATPTMLAFKRKQLATWQAMPVSPERDARISRLSSDIALIEKKLGTRR